MQINGTNFTQERLPKQFEQKRISLDFSEDFSNDAEKIRQGIFANSTVGEILKMSETEEKFKKLKELVGKIDDLITSKKSISYSMDFRLFKEIYGSLSRESQKVFNSKYLSQTGELFNDYQKYYLRERILSNLRMEKPNLSLLGEYIFEYKKLEKKTDLNFLLEEVNNEEEKQKILEFFNEYGKNILF